MNTKENISFQEIEQLCRAYIDCNLSRVQEKELELVLLCSDYASPIIDEARELMGISSLLADSKAKSKFKVRPRHYFFKYAGIAACFVIFAIFSGYVIRSNHNIDKPCEVYVYINGKVISGHEAQYLANKDQEENMSVLRSVIEETVNEQRQNAQYLNIKN